MAQTVRTNLLRHRICQDYENELYTLNIPINRFNGAMVGILAGKFTTQQVTDFFSFSQGELDDWNTMIARITAQSNTVNTNMRDRLVEFARTVLIFYEDGGIPGFETPDDVWGWLSTL